MKTIVCEMCGKEVEINPNARRQFVCVDCRAKRKRIYAKRYEAKRKAAMACKQPMVSIVEVAKEAKAHGMSYGEYVARRGL